MALAKWHTTITDQKGNVLPNAQVSVRNEATGAMAVLYTDRGGTQGAGNPFNADAEGFVSFHVTGGAYRIKATSGSFEREWRYVGIGTAQEMDADGMANLLQAGVVPFRTKADLLAFIPEAGKNVGGAVWADPVGANNGYYIWSGVWTKARSLPDTFARLIINGGTANNILAVTQTGIDPASPMLYFIDAPAPNTGNVTLSVNGAAAKPVLTVSGDQFSPAEFTGRILLTLEPSGYKAVTDANAAVAAALSATAAHNSANAAAGSASASAGSASSASSSASASSGSATSAQSSASTAQTQAQNAAGSASTASTKASEAAGSASAAAGSASTATTQAGIATTKAGEASASATAAAGSASASNTAKTGAETARTEAQTARTGSEAARDAAVIAKNAAESAQAGVAANSTAAANSASAAAGSASTASTKAGEASSSAGSASGSATAAANSASAAAGSASTASTKAGEAVSSASAASGSADAAASSASAANTAKTGAEAARDKANSILGNLAGGTTGQMLTKQSAADWDYVWKDIAGGGTVTSIGLVVPAGFAASGPVTTSGDITITYTSGYQGFTTAESVKLGTIATNADVTTSAKVGAALAGPTPSTVLNDGDKLGGILSGGAVLATWSWATIKAGIKTLTDTLYATKAQGTKADSAVQPAGLTKDAVGLGSVDNTSDASKPVSTPQQNALNLKVSNSRITISAASPSGGVNGDLWFKL